MMHLAEVYMKRLGLVSLLVILLVVGAISRPMSTPSFAQGYGGYVYPPPPQNPYATPWVGAKYAMGLLPRRLVFKWDAVS